MPIQYKGNCWEKALHLKKPICLGDLDKVWLAWLGLRSGFIACSTNWLDWRAKRWRRRQTSIFNWMVVVAIRDNDGWPLGERERHRCRWEWVSPLKGIKTRQVHGVCQTGVGTVSIASTAIYLRMLCTARRCLNQLGASPGNGDGSDARFHLLELPFTCEPVHFSVQALPLLWMGCNCPLRCAFDY